MNHATTPLFPATYAPARFGLQVGARFIAPLFVFSLQFPAFTLLSATEDASTIAHRALQSLPPGNWTLSAALSTRIKMNPEKSSSKGASPQNNECNLVIQLNSLKDGSHEAIYRSENEKGHEDGVSLLFPKEIQNGIQVRDLTTHQPVKSLQSSFLQSLFSMEDISLRFLSWKIQKFLGPETLKDRACWKIASYPSKKDPSAYARVESWIDQEYQALLKAVAYDAKGEVMKEFNVRSVQELEDVWMLKMLEIDVPLFEGRSRLEILDARKKE